jgi:dipeptidyl aminopeptidase/acylaminoacyl peptidase
MVMPYGSWPSPISAAIVAAQGVRLSNVALDDGNVYWLEGRPSEGGRHVIVRRAADGATHDVTPPGFNARTRVHEYGGGAFAVRKGLVCVSNFDDQRLYRMDAIGQSSPVPITPEGAWCYADGVIDDRRRRFICVREDHMQAGREPVTTLVAVALGAAADTAPAGASIASGVEVLVSGYDFYSTPRLSPDGTQLAWLCWNHPQMPWDGTELWVARVSETGAIEHSRRIAGGEAESIYQPGWSPDGALYFVSDRTGWWQLYRLERPDAAPAEPRPVIVDPPPEAEFGRAQWALGTQTWACAGARRVAVSFVRRGRWQLALVDVASGRLTTLDGAPDPHEWLAADEAQVVFAGSSPQAMPGVLRIDLERGGQDTLRAVSIDAALAACLSAPQAIEYAGARGLPVHAFYYPPTNGDVSAPAGDRPPLIAISHGGPTTATSATLDLRVQFWTSRGFAVIDVNYGGSTGYGRPYRERLRGAWGIVDVDDVISGVRHLVSQGKADPERLAIRGGSAGGYTTLAALTQHPEVFRAGASYYGVSDLEALARDTHKFESRYLDSLVGPYPSMRDEYRRRSPIHHVERLSCALIFFQGLEDRVVPPDQSATMVEEVRRKGLPVAYLTFEGEQHGFRRAETMARCLEAELQFYGAVFGFEPADRIEPVAIENLPAPLPRRT